MKVLKYVCAAVLSLLVLDCSQGLKHSSLRNASRDKNSSAAAWNQIEDKGGNDPTPLRRLESVTWDSVKHELKWEVSKGEKKGNGYEPRSSDRYEISMDTATMTVNGKSRRFSEDEAVNVRALMDFISKYALESTVWWENGEGEPLDGKGFPIMPEEPKPKDRGKTSTILLWLCVQ